MGTVPTNPYITRYLDQLVRNAAEATVDTYRYVLCQIDRELRPTGGLVKACAEDLEAAISYGKRSSQSLRRAAVRSFFAWANDPRAPIMDFNPALYLKPVKVPRSRGRAATTDELADILSRATDPLRIWYVLAAGAGLRCVEISNLDREHVDRELIWVQGKGSVERYVDTHELVWETIKDLPRGPIARQVRSDRRASRQLVQHRANPYLHKLGYPMLTMHGLRRWYGTNIHAAAGGDVLVTQELLGHASPETTQIYVRVPASKKRAATSALPLPMTA